MRNRHSGLLNLIMRLMIFLVCAVTIYLAVFTTVFHKKSEKPQGNSDQPASSESESNKKEETEIKKESTFTLSATGDVLIHMPLIKAASVSNGEYDFSSVFRYFSYYVSDADFAVANLETTLAGDDNGYDYDGYPTFNCPDNIVDSVKNAGFDLLLTANNHCYDTRSTGFHRTIEVIREKNLKNLGTKASEADPDYVVVKENDISLGMLCYTYEDDDSSEGKAPNGITMKQSDTPLINSFDYAHLDQFYQEIENNITSMKNEGANAVILFIHWGNEYQTTPSSTQSKIAQKLCDLGVDVIIGGHPHVVQPVELLTSSLDPEKKTVCLFSMGNAVSNQRRHIMNLNTGHTEDGVLFSVTFARYTDGTVILEDAELLPTWVRLAETSSGKKSYIIIPLEDGKDWGSEYDLSSSAASSAKDSYDRTMKIVGEGMQEVDEWLNQHIQQTETQIGVKAE